MAKSGLPERLVVPFEFYRKFTWLSMGAVLLPHQLCRGNQCLSCTQLRSQSSLSCLLVSWPFGRLWPWCFLLWLDARQQPSTLWAECQDKVWADFPEISLVLEIASWARWLFRTKVQFPPLFSTLAISEGASSTYPGGDRLEEGQRQQHSCCWRGWEVTD